MGSPLELRGSLDSVFFLFGAVGHTVRTLHVGWLLTFVQNRKRDVSVWGGPSSMPR